ncbi:MAG: phage tail sheath C-terminal domain-containing protein, partial [Candidatus Sifarchaeia archaeon]
IDNSQVPRLPVAIGPLVIGRSRRGPAYQPVRVDSFSEFVTIFGNPVAGEEASDLWRSGVPTAPTFAAYAAQAWLKNSSPLTFIRLLGDQSPDAANTDYGKAGWKLADVDASAGGGAYGLFVLPSSSDNLAVETVDGTLAAVFYTTSGIVTLSGSLRGVVGADPVPNDQSTTGSAAIVVANSKEFNVQVYNSSEQLLQEAVISFDRGSNKYIRKVANTNPTLTNSAVVDSNSAQATSMFLGQSYERAVNDLSNADNLYGFIARLDRPSSPITNGNDFKFATQAAQTGWFFSQDLRPTNASTTIGENIPLPAYNPENLATVTRLFKLHGLTSGEEIHRNFKISIEDLNYSTNDSTPYGSFTLAIRSIRDTDNSVRYVERYTNLSLDPNSDNYIAKQIGDKYYEWSTEQRRLIEYGSYDNRSSIVRVEMANSVDQAQVDPEALPFGVEGPIKYSDFTISGSSAGSRITGSVAVIGSSDPAAPITIGGASNIFMGPPPFAQDFDIKIAGGGTAAEVALPQLTASMKFPSIPLRNSASDGDLSDPTEAYFGAQFTRGASSTTFEESCLDILYPLPRANTFAPVGDAEGNLVTSWYFSLDDLVMKNTSNQADTPVVYYASGSRALGDSITARTGSYKAVIDKGYDRFTTPLYGGFDGFDITEKEPFNQRRALTAGAGGSSGGSETTSAMFYSVKKAVDMFADPEFIESNILVAPGIRHQGLTTHMIETCESRGDAFALIDPYGGYEPASENNKSEKDRIDSGAGRGGISQHVLNVGNNLQNRNLNTSYGATYYPWVRISDTISGRQMWAPPSVAALGAMSFSENEAALWFAPAGFNRGGLTDGAAGIPVTNVRSRLTSKERDFLYERSVNPIASFPNEGIVIFGQKTLQVTPSALDRINVRRLMIFVKKEISRIASNLLFDQNVEQTWSRFTGRVNPFLDNIKNNFGLDDFRVILDETTTTPDLIDRNTIYAKIFLKPTKAVEFFAIDFVITNSGASFED